MPELHPATVGGERPSNSCHWSGPEKAGSGKAGGAR